MHTNYANEDQLICAQLADTARRATRQRWSTEYALDRMRSISDRPDLVAQVAGMAIGRWIERPTYAEAPIIHCAGLLILAEPTPRKLSSGSNRAA